MALFMKIEGANIKGNVMEETHKEWISLNQMSWGASRPMNDPKSGSANRIASKPIISEVQVSRMTDGTSPLLLQELLKCEKALTKVTLVQTKQTAGKTVYMTLELTDVFVSQFQVSADSETNMPYESLAFNFTSFLFQIDDAGATNAALKAAKISYNMGTEAVK